MNKKAIYPYLTENEKILAIQTRSKSFIILVMLFYVISIAASAVLLHLLGFTGDLTNRDYTSFYYICLYVLTFIDIVLLIWVLVSAHLKFYLTAFFYSLTTLVVLFFITDFTTTLIQIYSVVYVLISLILIFLIYSTNVMYLYFGLVITNKRILIVEREGINSFNYNRLDHININYPILGSILGYGTLQLVPIMELGSSYYKPQNSSIVEINLLAQPALVKKRILQITKKIKEKEFKELKAQQIEERKRREKERAEDDTIVSQSISRVGRYKKD